MGSSSAATCRHLVIVLGDQLDLQSAAFDGFDPAIDHVWMAEVTAESKHVWSHKVRIAYFLASMRHFRDELRARGWTVDYRMLDDPENCGELASELVAAVGQLRPTRLIVVWPGEYRVKALLEAAAAQCGIPLEIRPDRHFFYTPAEFARHAEGRKQLRQEFFYREARKRFRILLDESNEPTGGQWNYDSENRQSFGKSGPASIPAPRHFSPDDITREVLRLVSMRFADHPGSVVDFDWPVTSRDAQLALQDFLQNRLPAFGDYQDAMWTNEPWLYHSRLSAALNLKLVSPAEVVAATEAEYRAGRVPLAAAEGFIRQILGWREYVRGIYWLLMPEYLERNALEAHEPLPAFYWTGETDAACLRDAIGQTLRYGYAHHIQRLMVTGLFSLLVGVEPRAVHEWYLAVYLDAVEWVELPNTLGMSQYADGGVMASKPYIATGKYIQRMSNYCSGCRFDPAVATGPRACPFTTLYWDFLQRHETELAKNPRMSLQVKNLAKKSAGELQAIQAAATALRTELRGTKSQSLPGRSSEPAETQHPRTTLE